VGGYISSYLLEIISDAIPNSWASYLSITSSDKYRSIRFTDRNNVSGNSL